MQTRQLEKASKYFFVISWLANYWLSPLSVFSVTKWRIWWRGQVTWRFLIMFSDPLSVTYYWFCSAWKKIFVKMIRRRVFLVYFFVILVIFFKILICKFLVIIKKSFGRIFECSGNWQNVWQVCAGIFLARPCSRFLANYTFWNFEKIVPWKNNRNILKNRQKFFWNNWKNTSFPKLFFEKKSFPKLLFGKIEKQSFSKIVFLQLAKLFIFQTFSKILPDLPIIFFPLSKFY